MAADSASVAAAVRLERQLGGALKAGEDLLDRLALIAAGRRRDGVGTARGQVLRAEQALRVGRELLRVARTRVGDGDLSVRQAERADSLVTWPWIAVVICWARATDGTSDIAATGVTKAAQERSRMDFFTWIPDKRLKVQTRRRCHRARPPPLESH